MAEITGIAWTDSTFNPWIGCTKVGPGCDHCYAEALDKRHRWGGATHWGAGVPRYRTSESLWHHPVAWNAKPFYQCLSCGHRFSPPGKKEGFVTCPKCSPTHGKLTQDHVEASALRQVRRRVFCASLADVFDNEAPAEWRADLWRLIRATPAIDWLLLTKRIGNVAKMHPGGFYGNVWLGATVVNQEEADRDIPKLLAVNGVAKRFVSYEPALGPVDWLRFRGLDWIIVGGESGNQARPFRWDWARSAIAQCRQIGAAPFMKQTGTDLTLLYERAQKARNGDDPAEWPAELRVQEFPS